jgi:hypothetical protein
MIVVQRQVGVAPVEMDSAVAVTVVLAVVAMMIDVIGRLVTVRPVVVTMFSATVYMAVMLHVVLLMIVRLY